jgi:Acetyltransferase (GNAT) domain
MPAAPVPLVFQFLFRKTSDSFWVADDQGKIVGFSDSFTRGGASFWFLTLLFISLPYQGKDIGKNLLERTLASSKISKATNRATITFAFNPASQYLYMKYGMYPREPAYYVECPSSNVREKVQADGSIEFKEVSSADDASEILKAMDELVLGFPLGVAPRTLF